MAAGDSLQLLLLAATAAAAAAAKAPPPLRLLLLLLPLLTLAAAIFLFFSRLLDAANLEMANIVERLVSAKRRSRSKRVKKEKDTDRQTIEVQ